VLRYALVVWLAAVCDPKDAVCQKVLPRSCATCDDVVERVVRLLPRAPERIVVMDTARESRLFQQQVLHAEGFVKAADRTVYLKLSGPTFQHALSGPGLGLRPGDHRLARNGTPRWRR